MSKNEKSTLKYFKWLLGAFGTSYLAREAWIWAHMKNLKNEIVLITGGTSGIGKEMAKMIAKEGATVVIWARDEKNLDKVQKEIKYEGGKCFTYSVDVGEREQIYKTAKLVQEEVGDVTMVILNAAIVRGVTFLDSKDDDIEKVMRVNAISHFWTVRAFLPSMLQKNHGHIVTVSSAGGMAGTSNLSDYAASKFAAFGFNESLRVELNNMGHASKRLDNSGVQATIICPYFINTGMFEGVKKNNFNFLMPILETKYVAKKSIKAIKRGDGQIIMPYFPTLIYLMRFLFPATVFDRLMYDVVGVGSTMNQFNQTTRTNKDFDVKSKL
eukprot:gene502-8016_t